MIVGVSYHAGECECWAFMMSRSYVSVGCSFLMSRSDISVGWAFLSSRSDISAKEDLHDGYSYNQRERRMAL